MRGVGWGGGGGGGGGDRCLMHMEGKPDYWDMGLSVSKFICSSYTIFMGMDL